jgi:hypothetical protein
VMHTQWMTLCDCIDCVLSNNEIFIQF